MYELIFKMRWEEANYGAIMAFGLAVSFLEMSLLQD